LVEILEMIAMAEFMVPPFISCLGKGRKAYCELGSQKHLPNLL
jgi:hypothetical protein